MRNVNAEIWQYRCTKLRRYGPWHRGPIVALRLHVGRALPFQGRGCCEFALPLLRHDPRQGLDPLWLLCQLQHLLKFLQNRSRRNFVGLVEHGANTVTLVNLSKLRDENVLLAQELNLDTLEPHRVRDEMEHVGCLRRRCRSLVLELGVVGADDCHFFVLATEELGRQAPSIEQGLGWVDRVRWGGNDLRVVRDWRRGDV
ncbi:hypothetical protein C8R47DRAFT_1134263 [Mycena vitilis]|nr:hypothetical protein C8R47DRAFT_1134263 [Mycena vitilis]